MDLINTHDIDNFQSYMLNLSFDAIIVWNLYGNIIYLNATAEKLYGYSNHEAAAYRRLDMLKTVLPNGEDIISILDKDGHWEGEIEQLSRYGQKLIVTTKFQLIIDENNKKVVIEAGHNITDYIKDAETKWRKSLERYIKKIEFQANLLDHSFEAIFAWELDGGIIYWNKGAERMYEYSNEEALGSISHNLLKTVHPSSFDKFKLMLSEQKLWNGEIEHTTKSGKKLYIETSQQVITNDHGQLIVLETNRDITEQILIKNDLVESHQLNKEILESISDGFYSLDTEWNFTYINHRAANNVGYEPEELLGQNFWAKFPDMKDSALGINCLKVMTEKTSTHFEFGGSITDKYYACSIYPAINGIAVYWIDITEHRKIEQQLVEAKEAAEEANKAKSMFLANMSHEIRTPMNGIMGMAELLLMTELTEEQKDMINTINYSSDHLLHIINDILELSKIDAGKVELQDELVDILDLIKEKSNLYSELARKKGLGFEFFVDQSVPKKIIIDRTRLIQIATNLISNAIKFTEHGKISVFVQSTEIVDKTVTLSFSIIDTGIGIKKNDIPRLFNYFSQLDSSIAKKFQGTGLGLAISKSLVELMGGEIGVESEFGTGSNFYFTCVAKVPDTCQEKSITQYEILQSKSLQRLYVLLVEDDPANQLVIKQIGKNMNMNIVIASNGSDALSILEKEKFDLILMDIQLPGLSGLDITKIIREKEHCKDEHIPIIAITAYAMNEDKERCLNAGMDYYISKPFKAMQLAEAIEAVHPTSSGTVKN